LIKSAAKAASLGLAWERPVPRRPSAEPPPWHSRNTFSGSLPSCKPCLRPVLRSPALSKALKVSRSRFTSPRLKPWYFLTSAPQSSTRRKALRTNSSLWHPRP